MIRQGTSATELEKTVITGFNSKLAAKISAFKAAHSGVCRNILYQHTEDNMVLCLIGYNLDMGLVRFVHYDLEFSQDLRIH
jgi:hypothetical protein